MESDAGFAGGINFVDGEAALRRSVSRSAPRSGAGPAARKGDGGKWMGGSASGAFCPRRERRRCRDAAGAPAGAALVRVGGEEEEAGGDMDGAT